VGSSASQNCAKPAHLPAGRQASSHLPHRQAGLLPTCFPPITLQSFECCTLSQFFVLFYSSYNHISEQAKGSFMVVRFWGYDRKKLEGRKMENHSVISM
jgi:hypothetical protein